MSQTVIEKILSFKVGKPLRAGAYGLVAVDGAMASDTTAPQMIRAFEAMGGGKIWDPSLLSLVLDHAAPAPSEKIAALHQMIRIFAHEQKCHLYDVGEGICHHLMLEHGHVKTGDIFIGADSHSCTYGAIGAFGCGVGSTDLAGILKTGLIWLRVPPSISIRLYGTPLKGVAAKDIMLHVVGLIGPCRASYKVLEFSGDFFDSAQLASRIPFANMGAELGAKASIVTSRSLDRTMPDPGARYDEIIEIDVSQLKPQLCQPHAPHLTVDIEAFIGTKINMAFLGSCTNTRIEDLRVAASILKDKKVADGVRLLVVPASRSVLLEAIEDGTMAILTRAGATFLPPGCGPCVGTHMGVPGDDEVVISAANRNFRGRMGNPKAKVFLASPATVAASALQGVITNPLSLEHRDEA